MALDDLQRPELLPDRIADLLREAILDGRLVPGERLVEQKLAQKWGISRAPLREAIRQVASEGLVTLSPRRGASVSPVPEDGLADLFAVRGMMESFAVRLAARKATPDVIARLRGLVADMEATCRSNDLAGFYVAGLEFHNVLVVAAGNDVLASLYDQIKRQFRRYQAIMVRLPHLPETSIDEHRKILAAIETGDAATAAAASDEHIGHLIERFAAASASVQAD